MCFIVAPAAGQLQEPDNLHDLSEPLIDHSEGQLFLNEAFKIIMEEVVCKGTDVTEKVSFLSLKSESCQINMSIWMKLIVFFFFLKKKSLQVCEWKEPEELAQLLDLELKATGETQDRLLQRVKDVAKYSVKTGTTNGQLMHLIRL